MIAFVSFLFSYLSFVSTVFQFPFSLLFISFPLFSVLLTALSRSHTYYRLFSLNPQLLNSLIPNPFVVFYLSSLLSNFPRCLIRKPLLSFFVPQLLTPSLPFSLLPYSSANKQPSVRTTSARSTARQPWAMRGLEWWICCAGTALLCLSFKNYKELSGKTFIWIFLTKWIYRRINAIQLILNKSLHLTWSYNKMQMVDTN